MSGERNARAAWLAGAFAVLAFGLLAGAVFSSGGTDRLDQSVARWAGSLAWPGGERTVRAVSWFGSIWFLAPATVCVVVILALSGWRAGAFVFAVAVTGGSVLENVLKLVFHRPRPVLPTALAVETTYGFPSGHTTMTTVFFGTVAVLVWRVTRRPAPRAAAVLVAVLAIAVVALSRLSLGVHWLTDVAGGALVGLFVVVVSAAAFERVSSPAPARR